MKPESEPYIRIVVGILAVAAIPPLGIAHFGPDDWFTNLQNWQSGVGAFWGALFGLGAILIGALFNADLNRKRDDRLREEETRALAASIHAELIASAWIVSHLNNQIEIIRKAYSDAPDPAKFQKRVAAAQADLTAPTFDVFKANLDRIGLLGAPTATNLVASVNFALAVIAPYKNPAKVDALGKNEPRLLSTVTGLLKTAIVIGSDYGFDTMTLENFETAMRDARPHPTTPA